MTAKPRPSGYRNYTADGTYWTVRKHGKVYWVVRVDPSGGGYKMVEWWGGYHRAGAAGGAAAQLAYNQAVADAKERLRGHLHDALDSIGLGAPVSAPPVSPKEAPSQLQADGED
ncbi:hypothetical protein [Nocardia bhagyanarayanae]|uniref:Uncharacterized protein n=1 Tax=Nocardia bhagyanarayanae TaxID=1215925 RepID=A0A543F9T3_9NOCA|nr:hypothetical protein [Nocardia bhagyanarayanae]TQM30596.1 hypothetical protein FB390_2230 [Nocardia bhagyanarayanae]